MAIEDYASPGLRWGLLLEDHPDATRSFHLALGKDVGVPDKKGGNAEVCVCTIDIPGREPIVGWKPVEKSDNNPDKWVVLCAKTMGRALKNAGYPDDIYDLRDLMKWRRANAEIAIISRGGSPYGAGADVAEEPPRQDPRSPGEGDDGDPDLTEDGEGPVGLDDEVTETNEPGATIKAVETDEIVEGEDSDEVVGSESDFDSDLWNQLDEEIANLLFSDAAEFKKFCEAQNIPVDSSEWTQDDLVEINTWMGVEE